MSQTALSAQINARIEGLPVVGWQARVRLLLGVITFFEAFDLLLISFTLPLLKQQWQLDPTQVGLIVGSGTFGMLLGALCAGALADRVGRKPVLLAAMLLTGLFSALIACASDWQGLLVGRLLQGLGIGAEVPIAALYLSEIITSKVRGRFVLLYELSFPCGLMFAGVACTWALPVMGWRPLYWLGSVPIVLAVAVYLYVPESARWLAARGQLRRAQACMAYMERASGHAVATPLLTEAPVARPRDSGRWRQLFDPVLRHASGSVGLLWFLGYLVNFALLIWLPSLYVEVFSTSLAQALNFTLWSNIAGLGGCMAAAWCVDRIGRVRLLFGGYLGAGLSLLLIALTVAWQQVLLVALLAASCSFFLYAANMSLHLYTPELYPTLLRGKGAAWGALCNRSGALLGAVGMGWVLALHWGATAIFILLGGLLLLASAIALQARETRGQVLG